MREPTPVSRALAQMNIPHREFRHPGLVRSLAQAAAERDQQPEQIIRSILFRESIFAPAEVSRRAWDDYHPVQRRFTPGVGRRRNCQVGEGIVGHELLR